MTVNVAVQAKLEAGLAEMHLQLSADQVAQLLAYLQLISKWNRVHNLTAVRDPLEMVTLHLLDSLSVLTYVQASGAQSLLDVGAGAGLPSIPLAICMPQLQVSAIDAVQKKASFMRQVKGELGLTNFHVESGRVEALSPAHTAPMPGLGFDLIISRAFSEISLFIKLTRHLLTESGQWLAMKGVPPQLELENLTFANLEVEVTKVMPLQVAGLSAERHLVFLRPKKLDQ
jgi:16S rRNA (guanine527-N7)-methyltransferase